MAVGTLGNVSLEDMDWLAFTSDVIRLGVDLYLLAEYDGDAKGP